jgi:hypothetical protein
MDVQSVSLSTICSLDVHWVSLHNYFDVQGVPFSKCRNAGLSGIQSVRNRNEQKCRCRNQSGTGMLRYGTEIYSALIPIPAAIDLDADAQLCIINTCEDSFECAYFRFSK